MQEEMNKRNDEETVRGGGVGHGTQVSQVWLHFPAMFLIVSVTRKKE